MTRNVTPVTLSARLSGATRTRAGHSVAWTFSVLFTLLFTFLFPTGGVAAHAIGQIAPDSLLRMLLPNALRCVLVAAVAGVAPPGPGLLVTGATGNATVDPMIERERVIEAGVFPRVRPVAGRAVAAEVAAVGVVGAVTAGAIRRSGLEGGEGAGVRMAVTTGGPGVSPGEPEAGRIVTEANRREPVAAVVTGSAVAAPGPDVPVYEFRLIALMASAATGIFKPEAACGVAIAAAERASAGGVAVSPRP